MKAVASPDSSRVPPGFGACLLFALTAGACGSSTEPGVRLEVRSLPAEAIADPILSDQGYEVRLDSAAWNVSRVEVIACTSAFQRVYDQLIPSARAHTTSSPTASGVPVIELATEASTLTLASLHPPADRYCSLRLTLAPADPDAVNLAEVPKMKGYTLRAAGHYSRPGGESKAFSIASVSTLDSFATGLSLDLSKAGTSLDVGVEKSAAHWFDAIDFEAGDAQAAELQLSQNVRDSLRIAAE